MPVTSIYPVWGWGRPAEEPRADDLRALAAGIEPLLGFAAQEPEEPGHLRPLADPRVGHVPEPLAALCSDGPTDRARHGLGRSYRDVVRGMRGRVDHVPDVVVRPCDEGDVAAVLDWAADAGLAVVPFGGGTSVVGGVEPALPGGDDRPVVSLDLSRLSGVAEVDSVSRAALVRAGTSGPDVEDGLRQHGLTLRFYPQSFERSTVGGWLATRAAGHFSSGPTHIDDLVESVRAVTPSGVWESRRLPASGAGPSPDRMVLGSEGTLGVITSAWLRVRPRPAHRWSSVFAAPDFTTGAGAVHALLRAGLRPATCRLVDGVEARLTGTLTTGEGALVLGFESPAVPVEADRVAAVEVLADAGLRAVDEGGGGAGEQWRSAFLRAPYLRDSLVLLGVLAETFETAVTWDHLDALVASVREATERALREVCGGGVVTCRLTHVYEDGAAPYFTVLAPARRGAELDQWAQVKAAASEALTKAGGTITHHHAVGRDHRPWYDRQRPDPFASALRAAKRALDPAGLLNPGVLIEPDISTR